MTALETRLPEGLEENDTARGWNLCRRPWWEQVTIQNHRSTPATSPRWQDGGNCSDPPIPSQSAGAVAKAFHLQRRRLWLNPDKKLYFPYEPGKQATSAIRIKNASRSHVAFKFQTTAPKSCFMRPPNGVLSPGKSIVATVVKFIEHPERTHRKQAKDKFKIVSLKVGEGAEFSPELFEEQKGLVAVEQILCVHFLDPDQPTAELEKLKKRIAEADAASAHKKPAPEENGSMQFIGEGNVLEEWNKLKLARQLARDDSA